MGGNFESILEEGESFTHEQFPKRGSRKRSLKNVGGGFSFAEKTDSACGGTREVRLEGGMPLQSSKRPVREEGMPAPEITSGSCRVPFCAKAYDFKVQSLGKFAVSERNERAELNTALHEIILRLLPGEGL